MDDRDERNHDWLSQLNQFVLAASREVGVLVGTRLSCFTLRKMMHLVILLFLARKEAKKFDALSLVTIRPIIIERPNERRTSFVAFSVHYVDNTPE